MARASKSTRKFEKTHLKRAVGQRKVEQKWKQKLTQQKRKKGGSKEIGAKANEQDDDSDDEIANDFKNKELVDHKEDLDNLAKDDPEFYKYLQENDKNLLDFDPSVGDDVDDSEDEGEEEEPGSSKNVAEEKTSIEITTKQVKNWKKALKEQHSVKALKDSIKAFASAVREDQEGKFAVTDSDAFRDLLVLVLVEVPPVVKHHVPNPAESVKLKQLTSSLKTHSGSLTTLLKDTTDSNTISLVLKSIHALLPYFLSYRRVVKEMIKAVVDVTGNQAGDDSSRLVALSFLQSAASSHPKSLLDQVLKATYAGLIKNSRRSTIRTMGVINMQKNMFAELYSVDDSVSYQVAFRYIRQLAVHLRSSIVNKTAESHKMVYNWQYLHSLDFWSRVLAASPTSASLRELIHPLVQVTLGTIRLIPSPQYAPLRFYLIRSLLRLSATTGVYIPIMPLLTEVLSSSIFSKKARAATLNQLDFDHVFRASKAYLGTRVYQDGVADQILDLIGEFYMLHCKSIAFPELAIPTIIALRRFVKQSQNIKFNRQLQNVVEKLSVQSEFVEKHRATVTFGPADQVEVMAFLKDVEWDSTPLGKYVKEQRALREERARILRESLEQGNDENEQDGLVDLD